MTGISPCGTVAARRDGLDLLRRFPGGAGALPVKGAGAAVPPCPARAHGVPRGSPTPSTLQRGPCIAARIRSCLGLPLALPSTAAVPRLCPQPGSLSSPAGPSTGHCQPWAGASPCSQRLLCAPGQGHFPGICAGHNLCSWLFSVRAQHVQVRASATFPGRGVSRQDSAGIALCRCR